MIQSSRLKRALVGSIAIAVECFEKRAAYGETGLLAGSGQLANM